jgi:hypothetical protein
MGRGHGCIEQRLQSGAHAPLSAADVHPFRFCCYFAQSSIIWTCISYSVKDDNAEPA